jgi:two-component system response regulator YesN
MTPDKKYNVMIVEDEVLQRENISRKISSYSPSFSVVKEAGDGEEALAFLSENSVDIVFTDIVMPGMNGMDFLAKATALYSDIKFVILSGYSEFKYAQLALKYGVKDYLLKPVMKDEIYAVLTRLSCEQDIMFEPQKEINMRALFSSKIQPGLVGNFKSDRFHVALICIGNYVSNYRYTQDFEDAFDSFWSALDIKRLAEGIADEMGLCRIYCLRKTQVSAILYF